VWGKVFWATDGLVVAAGVDATASWVIFKPGVAMFCKGLLTSVALCMGLGAVGCCTVRVAAVMLWAPEKAFW